MKKLKITALVLLCIITAGLCGIFAYGMTGHDIYRIGYGSGWFDDRAADMYGSPQLVFEKEVPLDGIDNISIQYNMNNNDIYLCESENENLTIKEYSELNLDESECSTVTARGGTIEVTGKRRAGRSYQIRVGMFGIRTAVCYTEVGLPASYRGQLSLSTVSGDISSQMDIVLEKDFTASTSSGDVSVPLITAKNVTVECTSGDVEIETIKAEDNGSAGEIHVETSSGDIDGKQFAGDIRIKSTSGDIEVNQLTGDADIKSSSGYVEAETISGETQITTTSGDVNIRRIDGTASLHTSSGAVEVREGSGGRTAKTTSGDVTLNGVDGLWDIEASSGGVQLSAVKGSGRISTTSGDIRLEIEDITGSLTVESSSGYADIKISENNAFEFKAETTSGDIHTFFDDNLSFSKKGNSAQGTYGNNSDDKSVIIKTTSGDVQIKK